MKSLRQKFQANLIQGMDKFRDNAPPVMSFFIYFFFIVLLRTFLETIYAYEALSLKTLSHLFFSYLWVATSFMVVTKLFFLKEDVEVIVKLVFSMMGIILLPPIIDLVLSGGKGLYMTYYTQYLDANGSPGFWEAYFTFFGSYKGFGATPGIKVELILGMFLAFSYGYFYKNKNVIISLLYSLSIYLVVVALGFFPYLFSNLFSKFNLVFQYDHNVLGILYILITIFNCLILFAFKGPNQFKSFLRELKRSDIYYLFLMAIIGVIFQNLEFQLNQALAFRVILFFLSLILAQVYLIIKRDQNVSNYAKATFSFSLILAAYISFLSLFFMTIFLMGRSFSKLPKILFSIGSVAIMAMGLDTIFPNSFPQLNLILFVFSLSFLFVSIKELRIVKRIFSFP